MDQERDPSRPVHYEQAGTRRAHRHRLPHVRPPRRWPATPPSRRPGPHPLRIRPRHGQQHGQPAGVLGPDLQPARSFRAASSGTGSTRASASRSHRAARQPVRAGEAAARRSFWAYGGDFGPPGTPSDDNFCCNGLVSPDRKPHPGPRRSRRSTSTSRSSRSTSAKGEIEVTNWYDFTNLKDIADGARGGSAPTTRCPGGPPARPGPCRRRRAARSTCRSQPITPEPGAEYCLDLSFRLQQRHALGQGRARDGLGAVQVAVEADRAGRADWRDARSWSSRKTTRKAVRHGRRTSRVAFDKRAGLHHVVACDGDGTDPPSRCEPHFWRAPTDNDRGNHMPSRSARGVTPAAAWKPVDVAVERLAPRGAASSSGGAAAVDAALRHDRTPCLGTGDVVVEGRFTPGAKPAARAAALRHADATARPASTRSPGSAAARRKPTATATTRRVGLLRGTVDEQFFHDYSEPGEIGQQGRRALGGAYQRDRRGPAGGRIAAAQRQRPAVYHRRPRRPQAPLRDPAPRFRHAEPRPDADGRRRRRQLGRPPHAEYRIQPAARSYRFRLRPLRPATTRWSWPNNACRKSGRSRHWPRMNTQKG